MRWRRSTQIFTSKQTPPFDLHCPKIQVAGRRTSMRNVDLKSTFLVSANLAILLHAPLLTNPLSFHMASFEPSLSKVELDLSGDAAVSPSGSALQLNRAATNSSGGAFYHKAMQLWELNGSTTHIADFTTLFYFNISTSGGSSARDGAISFLLLPPAAGPPNSHSNGDRGGSLGKSGSSAGQENQIVAVEFNLGLDARSDHFGIDVSSTKSRAYVNVSGGFVNKGAATVRVDYDSKAKNLSASLGLSGSMGSYQISYVVDLSVVLPEKVRVGFTASAGTSGYVEIHQVLSWSFSSSLEEEEEDLEDRDEETSVGISKQLGSTGTIVLVVLAVVLVILLVVAVVIATVYALGRRTTGRCSRRRRRRGRGRRHRRISSSGSDIESMMEADAPKKFSYAELSEATDNFAEESKIGEGGCGCVYSGRLRSTTDPNQMMDVAIKKGKGRLDDQAGKAELLKEMVAISKTKHRNLVKLIGWCEDEEGGDLLLVFEFIPNGTLAQHLFARDQAKREALDWGKRYEIARRLASGLQYLHEGLHGLYVVHRDIKASNVMLDYDYNPKLGDFGLARFTDHGNSMVSVSTVGGTCGYMDPELTMTDLKYTKPSDVYSFGILALEIATGIRATTLAQAVWILHTDNAPMERVFVDIMDRSPKAEGYNMDEARRLIEVGFRCCDPRSASRPSMTQVMNALTNEAEACPSSSPAASTSCQTASFQRIPTI